MFELECNLGRMFVCLHAFIDSLEESVIMTPKSNPSESTNLSEGDVDLTDDFVRPLDSDPWSATLLPVEPLPEMYSTFDGACFLCGLVCVCVRALLTTIILTAPALQSISMP